MRCIDADALRDRLQNLGYDDWNQGATTTWAEAFSECADMVEEMPTIEPRCETCEAFNKTRLLIPQPERKKGKWIKRDVSRQIHGISCSAPNYQCSVCKKWWFHNGECLKWYKFCPECGADMRGDDHDL